MVAALVLGAAAPAAAAPAADPFADCEQRMTAAPDDLASSGCFYQVASAKSLRPQARERLAVWLQRRPGDPGLTLALANNESDLELPEAEARYRTAIAGFRERKITKGIVFASLNLANLLGRRQRAREADEVLAPAEAAASSAGDRMLVNAVRQARARLLWEEGRELGRAYRILREVEAEVFPQGHPITQWQTLHALGGVCSSLGRRAEAIEYYRRLRGLVRAKDALAESTAVMRMAVALMADLEDADDPRAAQAMAFAREAIALSQRGGGHFNESLAHHVLGMLGPRDQAAGHFRQCADYARGIANDHVLSSCLLALAEDSAPLDDGPAARALRSGRTGDEAVRLADEGVAAARHSGDPRPQADALGRRAHLLWLLGRKPEARAGFADALAAVEAIRDTQRDDRVRLELLADRGDLYYTYSGLLLADGDVDAAWTAIERLRARTLIERLDAGQATAGLLADTDARRRRDAVLDRIEAVQRALVAGPADEAARAKLLADLAAAEAEEAELRTAAAAADPRFGALRVQPAALAEVRAALADDEALLSYQLARPADLWRRPAGGSWLVVVTRREARALPLAARGSVAAAVGAFADLVARGDPAGAAAARLHADLIAPALALLPPGTRRLILVPDGALFRLPFAALRATPDAAPLVATHALAIAPSATTWLRLHGKPDAGSRALVLADPELPAPAAAVAGERSWALATAAQLGRLPRARDEAAAVADHLGGAARVLLGADASEAALKREALAGYGVLHFAAHALVDDQFPERSAVLLAPGAADEDGLLQPREIAALDVGGRAVVLSACRSAAGEVLRGEGLMDLTRTFLMAGARVVVGSLWQVRDDDAAALVDVMYRHLAAGQPIDTALARAQQDRAAAGAPPSAWAGFVVVGDGAHAMAIAKTPRPASSRARRWWWWAAAALPLTVAAAALWVRRRRRR
jgi:CHAT domain-containing protein